MSNTHSLHELGLIPIQLPGKKKSTPLIFKLSKPKFIIEYDSNGKIKKYNTNQKVRDHLDDKLNSYYDTFYLDANDERLKAWTTSAQSILRLATYLNHLLGYALTMKEIELFRKENKLFIFHEYRQFISDENNQLETGYLMAGIIDFSIIRKNNQLDKFLVSGDLLELFSDCADHEDIEVESEYILIDSPYYDDIDFASDEKCFYGYAYTAESLVDLVTSMNQLLNLHFTEEDKSSLLESIHVVMEN